MKKILYTLLAASMILSSCQKMFLEEEVLGCMDEEASNYNPLANSDDGSYCCIDGCTDVNFIEYVPQATCDDGSCTDSIVNGCTDLAAPNYDPLANSDDGSCIGKGDTYQGGVIFYLDGIGGGLIAAPSDQASYPSNQAEFGEWCNSSYSLYTDLAIGTGAQNTIDILSWCTVQAALNSGIFQAERDGYAAVLCANLTIEGYDDWFLPSRDELEQMWYQRNNIGGFTNGGAYCSSSCSSVGTINWPGTVWAVYFAGNGTVTEIYNGNFNVRAIRAFGTMKQ
jgi:hypothetical protein